MKSRLETLEELVTNLQAGSSEDANYLLEQIRSTKDLRSVIENQKDKKSDRGTSDVVSDHPMTDEQGAATKKNTLEIQSDRLAEEISPYEETHGSERTDDAVSSSGSPARWSSKAQFDSISFPVPDAALTEQSLDGFFGSSGKLFHVFSREQVDLCFHQVYNGAPANDPASARCCLFAVAAVGAQYMGGILGTTAEMTFYNIAKLYFEDIVEAHPYEAIKVCTLLAMFNIMNKAMVSLAYVGKLASGCQSRICACLVKKPDNLTAA
jgi:hypothetical protein